MRPDDPCRIHAPVVAALEEYGDLALDPEAVEDARAHLATCGRCQARSRSFARMDGALRGTMRAEGATLTLSTADLLAAIGADHEPRERRTPMLSVITMRDEDDMDDEDQTTHQPGQTGEEVVAAAATNGAPARTFAALPSLKPATHQPAWRRNLTSLVAVAAVIALVGGILGAMTLSGRLHGALGSHHTGPVATATDQGFPYAGIVNSYQIRAISMYSPTDGYAVALNQFSQLNQVAILRIAHGVATKQTTLSIPGGFGPTSLQALSATNVWLMFQNAGQGNFYHYDGTGWALTHLPAPAGAQGNSVGVLAYQMGSATEGWAIAGYSSTTIDPNGISPWLLAYYRYDGSSWHIEQADHAATVGGIVQKGSTPGATYSANYQINGISATTGGDVWATGWVQTTDSNGNVTYTQSVILHRAGGVWHVARTAKNDQYFGIAMSSPTRGWVFGMRNQPTTLGPDPVITITNQTPIALSWDGVRWSPATIPQRTQSQLDVQFNQIVASGPANAWLIGSSSGTSFTLGSKYADDNTYLAHFDGARWSLAPLPQIAAINPHNDPTQVNQVAFNIVTLAPNGDLWLAGGVTVGVRESARYTPLLYRYSGGQWTSVTLPAKI